VGDPMPDLTANEVCQVMGGDISPGGKGLTFSHFHFDTRLIRSDNTLFFALKTEADDGHRYLDRLEHRENSAAVVSAEFDGKSTSLPLIRVKDPLRAAHKLASYVRNRFNSVKYIGVTGSAGKTTTKEFIYQVLSSKYRVFRSIENWNNWIGLPFSVLAMSGCEQVAVFELAMSYPGIGEIDLLAEILRPDIAVILNVFPVHLEFLKNLENVAIGKSEILNYLSSDGVGFINGDSEYIVKYSEKKPGKKIFFGSPGKRNDIVLKSITRLHNRTEVLIDFYGVETIFTTDIFNRTQIENLFVAIIVAQSLGLKNVEIQAALKHLKPLSGRGQISRYRDFTVIDETYNSNPEALKKTLKWVDEAFGQKKIAIIGDMLELGEHESEFHARAGEFFATLNFDLLITVGKRAINIAEGAKKTGYNPEKIMSFSTAEEAGLALKNSRLSESVILLKASRGMRLEKILEEIRRDRN
jgi:UDP-N-acetylmuramoyl-tripeptide--D-alanyl-D-alanine ligase